MSGRPTVLFLSHLLPYPPHAGAPSRTFNVLRQLSREFDVALVMFSRRSHQRDAATRERSRAALEQQSITAWPAASIPSEDSLGRRIWDHVRSVATSRAYLDFQYRSADFRTQLRDALSRRRPKLIHLDSIDLHGWLDELPDVPTTCTHHDIESHALQRRATRSGSAPMRWYLEHQATLVERLERTLCPTFAANLVMSPLDGQRLARVAPGSRTVVVPNGVDLQYFAPQPHLTPDDERVVFIGSTFSHANSDAVEFLLADIWPRVRRRRPFATLMIVGGCSAAERHRFETSPGVTCVGRVDDIRPYVGPAACSVAPLRVGGGTRIKILDSWALGRAVVSTTLGCEGLEYAERHNILVRDEPDAFADAIVEVLSDERLRIDLGVHGRRTVERRYSWDGVGHALAQTYHGLLTA